MLKDYFCKFCMYKKKCTNTCLLENNLKNQDNAILWIDFNNYSDNILIPEDTKTDELKYQVIDDLFIVGSIKDYTVIYAPLLTRLLLVSNEIIEKTKPHIKFKDKYDNKLIEAGLKITSKQYDKIKSYLYSPQRMSKTIRIIFSSGCNLDCNYCYANSNKEITNINFKKLQFLIDSFPFDFKLTNLDLHGSGEPTFNFNEMKKVVELVKNKFPEIQISVQSNGQFNREIADWLLSNKISVGFSFDGQDYIQDKQRPSKIPNVSSHKNILENLIYFKSKGKQLTFISTITSYSLPYMESIYEYLKSIGCSSIIINPIMLSGKANPLKNELNPYNQSPDLDIFTKKFCDISIKSIKDGIKMSTRFLADITTYPKSHNCGAVTPNIFFLADGRLTACSETLEDFEQDDNIFLYGKCFNDSIGLKKDKIEKLQNRDIFHMIPCQTCYVRWLCGGGCLADCFIENGDIYKPVKKQCEYRYIIANNYFDFFANEMVKHYLQ